MISLKEGKYSYNEKEILGGGNYGIVYKCTVANSNERAVIKVLKMDKLKSLGTYGK